jgi:hypothetical protein
MKTQVFLNTSRDSYRGFGTDAQLHKAAEFELAPEIMALRDGQPIRALEHVFEQLNVGGDIVPATDWTRDYRAAGYRSLSVGDVVVLGETAHAVGRFGWERVTTDQLVDAIDTSRTYQQAMELAYGGW